MVSQEQIRRARQADLVAFLKGQGYTLKPERGQYRIPDHGGLLIKGNHWVRFADKTGGNTLDFCMVMLGMSFRDAVELLTGTNIPVFENVEPLAHLKTKKDLELPARAGNEHRVIAYLTKTRGLPADLVIELIRAGLLWQDTRGNCVFTCFDENDEVKGAIIEGTLSDVRWKGRAAGSEISYGWWWPAAESKTVIVVESPIDAMSLTTIRPTAKKHHLYALGGLHQQALAGILERLPEIQRVILAMDNDQAGQDAAKLWLQELRDRYQVQNVIPKLKDWNDDLRKERKNV